MMKSSTMAKILLVKSLPVLAACSPGSGIIDDTVITVNVMVPAGRVGSGSSYTITWTSTRYTSEGYANPIEYYIIQEALESSFKLPASYNVSPGTADRFSGLLSAQAVYFCRWNNQNAGLNSSRSATLPPMKFLCATEKQDVASKDFSHSVTEPTTYYYRVRAYGSFGSIHPWSNTVQVTVDPLSAFNAL